MTLLPSSIVTHLNLQGSMRFGHRHLANGHVCTVLTFPSQEKSHQLHVCLRYPRNMSSQHPDLLADPLISGCCFVVEKKTRQNKMIVVMTSLHFDPAELESVMCKYSFGQGKKN